MLVLGTCLRILVAPDPLRAPSAATELTAEQEEPSTRHGLWVRV